MHGAAPPFAIFVNYRRSDAEAWAGRVYDCLADRFGDDAVFMDVDTIELGVDFRQRIRDAIDSTQVLLAIVGPTWLTAADDTGSPRLHHPNDALRFELETALARGVRVIPVLVQGAQMPPAESLPDSLKSFTWLNAVELRHTRWRDDVARLVRALEQLRDQHAPPAEGPARAAEHGPIEARRDRSGAPWWRSRIAITVAAAVALIGVGGAAVALSLGTGTAREEGAVFGDEGDIWWLPLGGKSAKRVQLTSGAPRDRHPEMSPDGAKIAFVRDGELFVMDRDGRNQEPLSSPPVHGNAPSWSPCGDELVFDRERSSGGRYDVWLSAQDGSERNLTADAPAGGTAPDWSPAGNVIAFAAGGTIWSMTPRGGRRKSLTRGLGRFAVSPAWSPDGRRIAFAAQRAGTEVNDIYVMEADGSRKTILTAGKVVGGNQPTWSPDGDEIMFVTQGGLSTMNADGSGRRQLFGRFGLDSPSWSRGTSTPPETCP